MGVLPGCLPEQLPGRAGSSLCARESDSVHPWGANGSQCGMSVGTWVLTCYRESYGRACHRCSCLLLTTFLWKKIYYKVSGSRKYISCWTGASPIKKRSFAILVAVGNVHFNFAHKLFLINCRHLCWLFSSSLFTYLAIFARRKGYLSMN